VNKIISLAKKILIGTPSKAKEMPSDLLRLKKYAARKNNLKIHLGCGPRVLKDWINIDLAYEPYQNYLKYYKDEFYGKEVRGKKSEFFALNIVAQPLPLKNNSVSVVFHEDFIEHLDQKEQYLLLAEVFRILKKGGVHRINTPEITSTMKINSNFKLGFDGVFQEEWDKHVHKNILSVSTLSEMARIVGYSQILVQKRDVSKGKIPREYRPDPHDRPENGNLYVDLIK
jgi:predicted SAM-dependent methyltransferase